MLLCLRTIAVKFHFGLFSMMLNRFCKFFVAGSLAVISTVAAHADRRVALVIGNGAYKNTAALANPVNDAEDMAAALRGVGFDVIAEINLDKRSMEMAMARFGRIAEGADAALFYYAGHGMQYRGLNYLMPVDARLEDEISVNYELTRIDDVLFALNRARGVKILILDACRNNPLAEQLSRKPSSRDAALTRGLARIESARGTIVAYATQSNEIAVDGTSRNSPFTRALIKEIEQPGLEIATLFRRVAVNVNRETGGRQLPELSISMSGEFYLNTRETDAQAWVRVRQSSNITDLRDFIRRYPQSFLAADAQSRIAALERERVERERVERELQEQKLREQADRERLERERVAREQAEREKIERERIALEHERLAELAAREKARREEAARNERTQDYFGREKAGQQPMPAESSPSKQAILVMPVPEPPPNQPLLSGSKLVQEIKKELKRVGCYAGRLDDNWGSADTKASIDRFVRYAKLSVTPDEPAVDFLNIVRGKSGRICPIVCQQGYRARGDKCVPTACETGFVLGDNGTCVKSTGNSAAPSAEHSTQSAKQASSGSWDPYDMNRIITPGGHLTCGPKGCQMVPEGCHAVRHEWGGRGRGGAIHCP